MEKCEGRRSSTELRKRQRAAVRMYRRPSTTPPHSSTRLLLIRDTCKHESNPPAAAFTNLNESGLYGLAESSLPARGSFHDDRLKCWCHGLSHRETGLWTERHSYSPSLSWFGKRCLAGGFSPSGWQLRMSLCSSNPDMHEHL